MFYRQVSRIQITRFDEFTGCLTRNYFSQGSDTLRPHPPFLSASLVGYLEV